MTLLNLHFRSPNCALWINIMCEWKNFFLLHSSRTMRMCITIADDWGSLFQLIMQIAALSVNFSAEFLSFKWNQEWGRKRQCLTSLVCLAQKFCFCCEMRRCRESWAWWVFTTDIWEQQNGVRIDVQPQWNIFPVVRTPLIPQKREWAKKPKWASSKFVSCITWSIAYKVKFLTLLERAP